MSESDINSAAVLYSFIGGCAYLYIGIRPQTVNKCSPDDGRARTVRLAPPISFIREQYSGVFI